MEKEPGNSAAKLSKIKEMTEQKKTTKRNKRKRKRFIDVDVWRSEFGPVSVRAIFDVYEQKFNVEKHNMKNYSLQDCINGLRKLEDPSYMPPQNVSH